jgi:HlyD family secretion protein
VRLQSTIQENVVTYTVVVDVANPEGRLLPGMTTTVEFLVEKESGVWKVPNAALRFQPTTAMIEELRRRHQSEQGATPASGEEAGTQGALAPASRGGQGGAAAQGGSSGAAGSGGSSGPSSQAARGAWGRGHGGTRLFYVDEAGNLAVLPVRLGITDGQYTAISGRDLQEGLQVIAGVQTEATSSGANAFQSQQRGGRRFPGPGF